MSNKNDPMCVALPWWPRQAKTFTVDDVFHKKLRQCTFILSKNFVRFSGRELASQIFDVAQQICSDVGIEARLELGGSAE
jgi:hypothetical protein